MADLNPFPFPPNGFALLKNFWWPRSSSAFELALQYPWFRRHCPVASGRLFTTTLDVLAVLPTFVPSGVPEIALEQASTIQAYEGRLIQGGLLSYENMHLAVADGATIPDAPTGRSELLLAAHRNVESSRVDVHLHWPVIMIGRSRNRWWDIMRGYDASAIDRAFREGP